MFPLSPITVSTLSPPVSFLHPPPPHSSLRPYILSTRTVVFLFKYCSSSCKGSFLGERHEKGNSSLVIVLCTRVSACVNVNACVRERPGACVSFTEDRVSSPRERERERESWGGGGGGVTTSYAWENLLSEAHT